MARKKINLEYILDATSKDIIWDAISTPSGLEGWFADHVDSNDKIVTFYWGDNDEESREAEIVGFRSYSYIKFKWTDNTHPKEYFELRMHNSELTNDYVLEVKDFADADEVDDHEELWNKQIETLRRLKGLLFLS